MNPRKPSRITSVLALGLLLAGGCASAAAGTPVADREALERRQAAFFAAMAARDADRVAAHFADDAVLHVANMPPVEGGAAIRGFYGNVFRFLRESTATPELLRVAASGDMAYSLGRTTNVFAGEGGSREFSGKFVLIWERRDGDWRITTYGISNDRADGGG